ncbi:Penicillin-binding protein 1A (Includes: Penicillin-insensitive transglycosylase; Penicillin-sensitive transpeptidase) [Burkholderiales bacterium]|nr:Penicillin-binding protein 1A (Includes: Penicillin-insensitive transglycosylase; Penicillin-sensitive transpeptidase) [Burkholderiales bacterium]
MASAATNFVLRVRQWLQKSVRARPARVLGFAVILVSAALACVFLLGTLVFSIAYYHLPSIEALTDYRPKVPLRVWTADGVLLGEFGEERRSLVAIQDVPERLKQAILAAEDTNFYHHGGVDALGILRATFANLLSGHRAQGASTITMQVARNFFLSSERSYTRKVYEIALAVKIESSLSKDRILEVYINQIYLGQRAYGFASAAQIYFGKSLSDLTLGECAMLAELPKAPSTGNPLTNPKGARARQRYVLGRMLAINTITRKEYEAAMAEDVHVRAENATVANMTHSRVRAEYVAELARQLVTDVFHEEAYTRGLNVYTTISSGDQQLAYEALRAQVLAYDQRYGYRGPERQIDLGGEAEQRDRRIGDALTAAPDVAGFAAAVVLEASARAVKAQLAGGTTIRIDGEGLRFAATALSPKTAPSRRIVPGALIRVARGGKDSWSIVQLPQVAAAFVSADSRDGAVRALVGGFDFNLNKFDHVLQAWRQPGSSFKPFIYAAALEKGIMTSTLVNDAPVSVAPELTGGQLWEPKNYEAGFEGPMRLRQGLAKSKNMVSIRVLQAIGPAYAQMYITRFGFDPDKHPPFLTMALGAGSVTPWQELAAYAVFANGGFGIHPYIISRVVDGNGRVLMEATPQVAGDTAPRVLDARTAFIVDSMLKDVTRYGTAARAASLNRADVAGKTGTTNESHDAWFAGYAGGLVAIGWVGFDQPRQLGVRETGGGLALPIWIDYMAGTLKGVPESTRDMPPGVVQINGEVYLEEFQPGQGVASLGLDDHPPDDAKPPTPTGSAPNDQVF